MTHTTSKYSSVHFVSAIEGNMGATLNASWGDRRDDDEDEDIQYSEYPLSTGLADIKRGVEGEGR